MIDLFIISEIWRLFNTWLIIIRDGALMQNKMSEMKPILWNVLHRINFPRQCIDLHC